MFENCKTVLIEWLNTKGRAAAVRGDIEEIAAVMAQYPGPGAYWQPLDNESFSAKIAITELLDRMKPPAYVPHSQAADNIEGRKFWEESPAGVMLSSAFWVLYQPELISPIAAANALFPNKQQSSRSASTSVAYYAKKGWLTAFYRPPMFQGVQILNPDGKLYKGSWVVSSSQVTSRAALQLAI